MELVSYSEINDAPEYSILKFKRVRKWQNLPKSEEKILT